MHHHSRTALIFGDFSWALWRLSWAPMHFQSAQLGFGVFRHRRLVTVRFHEVGKLISQISIFLQSLCFESGNIRTSQWNNVCCNTDCKIWALTTTGDMKPPGKELDLFEVLLTYFLCPGTMNALSPEYNGRGRTKIMLLQNIFSFICKRGQSPFPKLFQLLEHLLKWMFRSWWELLGAAWFWRFDPQLPID